MTVGRNYAAINNLHGNHAQVRGAWAQMGETDSRLRVIQREFKLWLAKNGYNPTYTVNNMMQQFSGTASRGTIGAGTTLFGSLVNVSRPMTYDFLIPSPSASSGSPAQSTP